MDLKEAVMAKNKDKTFSKRAESAKESDVMRTLRIDGSQNGATLRTKVVRDKTKYNRNVKHKKSLADARDFAFIGLAICNRLFSASSWNAFVRGL